MNMHHDSTAETKTVPKTRCNKDGSSKWAHTAGLTAAETLLVQILSHISNQ